MEYTTTLVHEFLEKFVLDDTEIHIKDISSEQIYLSGTKQFLLSTSEEPFQQLLYARVHHIDVVRNYLGTALEIYI
jgi:hypothetical protein